MPSARTAGIVALSGLTLLVSLLAQTSCKRSSKPPREGTVGDSWHPAWLDGFSSPPSGGKTVSDLPMDTAGEVFLAWKFDAGVFGYDMRNVVSITAREGAPGAVATEARGKIGFSPSGPGRADVGISSWLAGSAPADTPVKTYVVDRGGRIQPKEERGQILLDLIFPMSEEAIVPGLAVRSETAIPDESSHSETRGATTMGVVGFVSVGGRTCAVVALEHEAKILAGGNDGSMVETGSVKSVKLVGWFDMAAGRYLAVVVKESSVTVRPTGETVTERTAEYLLENG